MKGVKINEKPSLTILTAYVSSQEDIESIAATPGWQVVGAFHMPLTETIVLELIGFVATAGLTMRARLFDLSTNLPIDTAYAQITSTTDSRNLSGPITLTGGRDYQLQVEVTGADGSFGVSRAVCATV